MWLYKALPHDILKYCFPKQHKSLRNKIFAFIEILHANILSRMPEFKNITLNIRTQAYYFNELNYAKHRMQKCTNKGAIRNRCIITIACYRWHSSTMYLSSLALIRKVNWKHFSTGTVIEWICWRLRNPFSQIIFENNEFRLFCNDKYWF